MLPGVACGILAGGAGSRMGRNKALLPFRGRTLLEHQVELLKPLFGQILLGANDPAPYAPFGLRVVRDLLPERCALTGIHALLAASPTEHLFVVACDLPFLTPALIRALLARRAGAAAVVPESDSGLEPLHALYSPFCLPAIESSARRGEWKATTFLRDVRADVWRVRDSEWAAAGPSPFTNVNTPAEWRAAGP